MKPKILTFLLACLFTGASVSGQTLLDYNGDHTMYLGRYIEYAKDTTGKMDVWDAYESESFTQADNYVLNLNFSKSPYWLKFKFKNNSDTDLVVLDITYPLLDSVGIYFVQGSVLEEERIMGDDYPISLREYKHQNYLVNLHIEPGETGTVLLRVRSKGPLLLPIRLLSPESFFENIVWSDIFKGVYFGIMCIMFFYNMIIFLITGDRNYVSYIFYIFFIYLTQASLDGFTYRFIFHGHPGLYEFLVIFFPAAAGISGIEFIKRFLNVKEEVPKFLYGLIAAQVIYASAVVAHLFGAIQLSFRIIDITASFIALFTIVLTIKLVLKGNRAARFFLVAWSFFLIGLVIFVLRNIGVVPFNDFTSNILHMGTAIEVVLLSIALADKITRLIKEKEESQAQALKVSRENEQIIRNQNINLEQKVNERTLELQEANEELTVTLSNLRDTQTQLVDAEKMASLGQLTAGIAHEINNPINFVTSNITPLKRDLDDVYELIEAYAAVSGENLEDLNAAHSLKEELDYDYLKEEISSLVKGISDGALRTSEIVRGLRTFSRLDEDVIKKADVHEGLISTMVLLRSKFKEGIEVVQDFDPELPEIECYPGKLNQVFMNILNNAIYAVTHKKYSDPEVPALTIRTKKVENMVQIHLIDNGVGMDEQTRKKMFDPFFTTKDVGEGTGLGMAIVYKIIEKHRGSLVVESEMGKGTEFIITLPLRQPNEFE